MSFVGHSYVLQHRKADVQRVINLYPVINEVRGGKSVAYLESVPGLSVFGVVSTTDVLLMESGDFILTEAGAAIELEAA